MTIDSDRELGAALPKSGLAKPALTHNRKNMQEAPRKCQKCMQRANNVGLMIIHN